MDVDDVLSPLEHLVSLLSNDVVPLSEHISRIKI